MTELEKAARQALEALEQIAGAMPFPVGKQAITALRRALEQPEVWVTPKLRPLAKLAKELDGVIADVEQGDGFDAVCLDTVKYVRDELAEQPAYRAVKTFHEGKPVFVAEQPAQQEPGIRFNEGLHQEREARLTAAQQEPVAWRTFDGEGGYDFRDYDMNANYRDDYIKRNGPKYASWVEPLYTRPQAREPLTDEEIEEINVSLTGRRDLSRMFARAIEAKLREKNT